MITIQSTGNIGRVEMKQVGVTSLLEFSLGCSTGFGERKKTSWMNCKMWGKRAEAMEQHFTVGKALVVSGTLEEETWEKDGDKRSKMVMTVNDFDFQQGGKSDGQAQPKSQAPADDFDVDSNIPF